MPRKRTPPATISREMRIVDVLALLPPSAGILAAYGLTCFSCALKGVESLEEGCLSHGFSREMIDALVNDLQGALEKAAPRPPEIRMTIPAARALLKMAKAENREGEGVAITVDTAGEFCMEFRSAPERDDSVFQNAEVPGISLFASPLALFRFGGATIDFVRGAFRIDLPSEALPTMVYRERMVVGVEN